MNENFDSCTAIDISRHDHLREDLGEAGRRGDRRFSYSLACVSWPLAMASPRRVHPSASSDLPRAGWRTSSARSTLTVLASRWSAGAGGVQQSDLDALIEIRANA
jgi:hypothetical protein